jgi:hypothetical protein
MPGTLASVEVRRKVKRVRMVVMLILVIALFLSVGKGEFVFLRRENGRVLVFIEKNVWCGPMRIKSKLGLLRDKRG